MRITQVGIIASQIRQSLTIISIEDSLPISVAYNTPFASIVFDSTVEATLSDESIINITVDEWIQGTYDQDAADTYDIYASLILPPDVINPFLIQGHTQVTVQPEIFTETFIAPTGFSMYTIPAGVTVMTKAKFIGAGGSGASMFEIGSGDGASGAAYSESDDFAVSEGDVCVLYIAPENISDLPTTANLNGKDGAHSQFGPAAPPGSTILSGAGVPGSGTGSDGNYYFDTTNYAFYGPKASGSWPAASATPPYVRAVGGKKGTPAGPGGLGGAAADCIGDIKRSGGNGIPPPASRSGAGGGAAGETGNGGNATSSGGTNSVGGTGNSPGGNGGNGSSGTAQGGVNYGGGGGGPRNTAQDPKRGGKGAQGWGQLVYSGASVPPAEPGDVYMVAIWGQSNVLSPGNGAPGAPYEGALDTQIWINAATGFEPLQYGVNNNPGGSLTGLGPELGIASVIGSLAPSETYISKHGQSGTNMFNNWNVANNSTGRAAVSKLKASLAYLIAQGKVIRKIYIVFRQGEADQAISNPNGPSTANVEAEYKDKFQDLIVYTIDQLEADGHDLEVVEFYFIDVLLDNVMGGSIDTTYQVNITNAQIDAIANFETDRPTYATRFAGGFTVSAASYTTMDDIHFDTGSEIQMGLDAADLMIIP